MRLKSAAMLHPNIVHVVARWTAVMAGLHRQIGAQRAALAVSFLPESADVSTF